MKFRFHYTLSQAANRPPNYVAEILAAASISAPAAEVPPDTLLDIPDAVYMALIAKYRHRGPLPPKKWPLWARAMRRLRKPEDLGVGSTVHRLIGLENSLRFKVWYKRHFKRDCGCAGRQARWDAEYPYNPSFNGR